VRTILVSVDCPDDQTFAKAMEVAARMMTGLVLDGTETRITMYDSTEEPAT